MSISDSDHLRNLRVLPALVNCRRKLQAVLAARHTI